MSRPATMANVINQMAFLRTTDPGVNMSRAVQLVAILHTAKEAATRYRTAVLHHADLSARLRGLFGYTRPEVWNGYVPPRTDGYGAYNDSPYRAGLVTIVTTALNRDDDWRHYDSDRLAEVPAARIRAPWAEARQHQEGDAAWPESDR